jgi:hypothetical protein
MDFLRFLENFTFANLIHKRWSFLIFKVPIGGLGTVTNNYQQPVNLSGRFS